jgi:hypothetical protein
MDSNPFELGLDFMLSKLWGHDDIFQVPVSSPKPVVTKPRKKRPKPKYMPTLAVPKPYSYTEMKDTTPPTYKHTKSDGVFRIKNTHKHVMSSPSLHSEQTSHLCPAFMSEFRFTSIEEDDRGNRIYVWKG